MMSTKRPYIKLAGLLVLGLFAFGPSAIGQAPPPTPGARPALTPGAAAAPFESEDLEGESVASGGNRLNFSSATIEIVLDDYAEKTQRTVLMAPSLPKATITLRSQSDALSLDEYLQAIESVLGMHGIALLEVGDKFLKVVPNAKAREESMPILPPQTEPPKDGEESDTVVSQMIALKYIDLAEAQKAIEFLKHPYGQIHLFERINSILVTDAQSNVNRITEIIGYIDQPVEAREEPIIVIIHNAKASEIKQKLEEIIADQQAEQKKSSAPRAKSSGQPGIVRPTVPGIIRARTAPKASVAEIIEMAERGIIRGKVKIVADDRTNLLIIITRPENMKFFDRIIEVLDVPTEPDVTVRVFRLEYAEAKTVATMLNDLIGATTKKDEPTGSATKGGAKAAEGSKALRDYVDRQLKRADSSKPGATQVGALSTENVKILSDDRTNALIIMASKGDLLTIEEIVRDMDMMLSQVLIETAIIDIQLGDSVATGVDWLQHALVAYEDDGGSRSPVMAFAGQGGAGDRTPSPSVEAALDEVGIIAGLQYYLTFFDLNLDVVVTAAARDSTATVVSMPIVATTDNTEAKITSTEKIYVLEGTTRRNTGGISDDYQNYSQQDVGLELTVTPHINDKKFVMMEISQTISQPNPNAESNPDNLAGTVIYSSRTIDAQVAVKSGDTIVLGGQVRQDSSTVVTGVPILMRLPLLGKLFSYNADLNRRTETVVFLTPTVLDTPEEISAETRRRNDSINSDGLWLKGWSASRLAEDPDHPQEDSWYNGSKFENKDGARGANPDRDPRDIDPALFEFLRMQDGIHEETIRVMEPDVGPDVAPDVAPVAGPDVDPATEDTGEAEAESGNSGPDVDPATEDMGEAEAEGEN